MANITVRDPFQEMRSLMRRAFDERFPSWFDESVPAFAESAGRTLTLLLDVYESADGLTVEAPLPGFRKDEIDVTLERGKLTIRAERKAEREEKGENEGRTYFLRERSQGVSSRSLLIGESYDADSVTGSLKDGVLTLSIKKAPAAQPRRVAIAE